MDFINEAINKYYIIAQKCFYNIYLDQDYEPSEQELEKIKTKMYSTFLNTKINNSYTLAALAFFSYPVDPSLRQIQLAKTLFTEWIT